MESDAHLSPAVPIDTPDGYPSDLDRDMVLSDGTTVHVRPIVPADIERVRHAFEVGDPDSVRRRFLTGAPPSSESRLHYLVEIDYRSRLALVALDGDGNSIGLGRYEGIDDLSSAEVAIIVAPPWRKRGVGGLLLGMLEAPARSFGIDRLIAGYQPDNRAIADLLTELGYQDRRLEDGIAWVAKALS